MDGDTQHHHLQFSPVLIGLMGVLAGAILVAIYQCLVNNCCCSQMRIQNAIAQQQNQQRQGLQINQNSRTPPVTIAPTTSTTSNSSNYSRALQLIPTYKYCKECKEGTCTVCLSDFKDGEAIRVLPECMHIFHVGCIDMWLSSHSNCPICRTDVLPPQPRHVVLRLPNSDVVPPPQSQPQHQHVVISISNRFTMPNFSGGSHMTT